MTRGELIFRVSRSLGLDDTVGSDERRLMEGWANDAAIHVLLNTRCYVDEGDMVLTAGVTDYRLDSNILSLLNVHLTSSGQQGQVEMMDMADLDVYLSSNIANGPPCYVAIDGSFMRIAPAPSTGDTMRLYYVPRPSPMTDDTHDPSTVTYGGIPTEYHDAIEYYMLWKGAEYDDKGGGFYRGHAYAPGFAYQQVLDDRVKEIRKQNRRKSGRGLHAGRTGYPRRGLPGRRNDVYPETSR